MEKISSLFWEKKKEFAEHDPEKPFIDFRNEEHIHYLLALYFELEDISNAQDWEDTTKFLIKTLKFYIEKTNLSDIQREILTLKMQRKKNMDIAGYINGKYGKTYSANYISTIFRQKIIKQITETVNFHLLEVENLFYPEN